MGKDNLGRSARLLEFLYLCGSSSLNVSIAISGSFEVYGRFKALTKLKPLINLTLACVNRVPLTIGTRRMGSPFCTSQPMTERTCQPR